MRCQIYDTHRPIRRPNNKTPTAKSLWFFSFNRTTQTYRLVCLAVCLFNALICSFHFASYWSFGWHLYTIRRFRPFLECAIPFEIPLFAQSNVVFCIEINAVVNAWPWQTKPYRWHHYEIHPKISKRNAHISPNASIFKYISKARMKKDKNKTLSKFMCSIQTQFDYSTIWRTTKKSHSKTCGLFARYERDNCLHKHSEGLWLI